MIKGRIFNPRALNRPSIALHAQSVKGEWMGLDAWRKKGVDRRLGSWGEKNKPTEAHQALCHGQPLDKDGPASLVEAALSVLLTESPEKKQALTHQAWAAYLSEDSTVPLHPSSSPHPEPPLYPARPDKPQLVKPKDVPAIGTTSLSFSGHMLHNLAHIELNAIDLAMDTVVRFAPLMLPPAFYQDFFRVADDEARHLGWCLSRMEEIGCRYGDMPAHDLLWEGLIMSSEDLDARLCIIPMGQEARGLDAGSRIAQRLTGHGDKRSAAIVSQIALEERAHVAVGVYWHRRVSEALGVAPEVAFRSNLSSLCPDLLKGPFNHSERELVGLSRAYYDIESWPQEAREELKHLPAEAAKIRGLGLPLDTSHDRRQARLTEGLRDRLGKILEMEASQSVG
jgi:uncharacterized ferritin-like protein (DUF455 family)